MELLSRLRLFNTQIEYPPCVYDDDSSPSEEEMDELTNFMDRVQLYTEPTIDEDTVGDKTSNLQESDENSISESSSISSEYDSDTSDIEMRINETALQLIDDDDGYDTAYSSDGDSSIKSNREEDPTELEIQMGSNVEFNVTLKKIIEDADRLSETQNIEEIMGPEEDEAIIDVENLPKNLLIGMYWEIYFTSWTEQNCPCTMSTKRYSFEH